MFKQNYKPTLRMSGASVVLKFKGLCRQNRSPERKLLNTFLKGQAGSGGGVMQWMLLGSKSSKNAFLPPCEPQNAAEQPHFYFLAISLLNNLT